MEMIWVHLHFPDDDRESSGKFPAVPRKGERLTVSQAENESSVAVYEFEVVDVEWIGNGQRRTYEPHLTLRLLD